LGRLDPWDLLDLQARLAPVVNLDCLAYLEPTVFQETTVIPVNLDPRDTRDQRDIRDLLDFLDLEV